MKNIIIFLLLLTTNVYADEFRFGTGFNFGTPVGDGVWKQPPLDNEFKSYGAAVAGQIIKNTNIDWLDYSVGFGYRKGATIRTNEGFLTDACYDAKQYSGYSANGSICDSRYHVEVTTKTYSGMLTLNPTWRVSKNLSLSSAIGVSLFSSTLKMKWDNTRGVCSQKNCEDTKYRNREVAPYLEATVKYGSYYLTTYLAWNENAPETPTFNNYGVIAGYSHKF